MEPFLNFHILEEPVLSQHRHGLFPHDHIQNIAHIPVFKFVVIASPTFKVVV